MRPSSPDIRFNQRDRLLIVAPHPDDETLACGELIQSALAAGAVVRVVFATDGDNNPWPQRWIEKRWRIGPIERVRWGARRRSEAMQALAILGNGAIQHRFLGRPDQGLTDELMHGDALVEIFAEELAAFAPTHLVLPSLGDSHPDHSALHVMLELALLRTRQACVRLAYAIHGAGDGPGGASSNPRFLDRKCAAMACYASQLSLSRGRLLSIARKRECFVKMVGASPDVVRDRHRLRIAIDAVPALHPPHEVLVVIATSEATLRATTRLPQRARPGIELPVIAGDPLHIVFDDDTLDIAVPVPSAPIVAGWAKLHRAGARIVVFDRSRWHALGDGATKSLSTRPGVADQAH